MTGPFSRIIEAVASIATKLGATVTNTGNRLADNLEAIANKVTPGGGGSGDSGHTFESVTATVLDGLVDPENDEYGSSQFNNNGFGPFAFTREPTTNDAWDFELGGNTYHATSVQSQTDYSEYECGSFDFYDPIIDGNVLSGSYGNFTAAILEDLYGEVPTWFKGDGYYFYSMYPKFDMDEEYHKIPTEMTFTVVESDIEFEEGFLKTLRDDLDIAPQFTIVKSGEDWIIYDENNMPVTVKDIPNRMVVFTLHGEDDYTAIVDSYQHFHGSSTTFYVRLVEVSGTGASLGVAINDYNVNFDSNGVYAYKSNVANLTVEGS